VDGNKRVAANTAITFFLMNDWELAFTEDALVDVVWSSMTKEALGQFFEDCCLFQGRERRVATFLRSSGLSK